MTTLTLQQLIANSMVEDPCSQGHDFQSDGGRACPNTPDCWRSQAVYSCTRCGEYDYGEPGGPGAADCAQFCGVVVA